MLGRGWDERRIAKLRTLNGEFRLTGGEKLFQRFMGVGAMAVGAYGIGAIWDRGRLARDVHDLWIFGAIMVAWIGVGVISLRQANYAYRFSVGVLQRLNGSGKVLWEESLSDVTGVEVRSTRTNEYLRIQWPRRTRSILLSTNLAQALADPEPQEAAEEASDGKPAEPVGPNWSCAKCGEENPGNFDECWKCETARP